ncbi:MAG: ATP synthase F0 subunit C [Actinomycetota bacterium]|nr:ATP synthase F0 subunit C [Actinomycetota bacterium]
MLWAAMICGWSIAWLGRGAVEGSARQPEAAGAIRTTMIIAAALIEAISLYTFVIAILLVTK